MHAGTSVSDVPLSGPVRFCEAAHQSAGLLPLGWTIVPITPDTPLIAVLENPVAKKALLRFLPSLADSPVTDVLAQMPLRMVVEHNATSLQSDLARLEFWSSLAEIDSSWTPPVEGPPIQPDPAFTRVRSVPVGSAQMTYPEQSPCWDVFEIDDRRARGGRNPIHRRGAARGLQRRRSASAVSAASTTATASYRVRFMPDGPKASGRSVTLLERACALTARTGRFDSLPGTSRATTGRCARSIVPLRPRRRHPLRAVSAPPPTPGPTRASDWRTETLRTLADSPVQQGPHGRSCRSPTSTTPTSRTLLPLPGLGRGGLGHHPVRPPRFFRRFEAGHARRCAEPWHPGRPHPLPPLRPVGLQPISAQRGRPGLVRYVGAPVGGLSQRLVVDGQRVRPDGGRRPTDGLGASGQLS